MSNQPPTRSAVLQLQEEQLVVKEAYDFLDEKRLLLAAELLRQLQVYEARLQQLEQHRAHALAALGDGAARHGLQGLAIYPAARLQQAQIKSKIRTFMGVQLSETTLRPGPDHEPARIAVNPSPEAETCRSEFQAWLDACGQFAGVSGNVHRLTMEYRKTERRARALEDVILPEINQSLTEMQARLEEMDQEDAVRVRLKYGKQA